MFQGGTQIVLGTSFTAKEEDIIGADNDYKALEAALRNEINNIERTHSGYDEYRYDLDEINHNPYELAAYLTVKFEDYTRDEVQATLQWLFEQQYELTLHRIVRDIVHEQHLLLIARNGRDNNRGRRLRYIF
jgi:hypothetical protein